MEVAADKNDANEVARLVQQLCGKSKRFSSKQPTLNGGGEEFENAQELADAWGVYAKCKFDVTEREKERGELPDIRSAASRSGDLPSYEEPEVCLNALSNSKAAGWDGLYAEVYKVSTAARESLFEVIVDCVREDVVPCSMVMGAREFVTIYKNKGSSEGISSYRFICLLTHAYKLLSSWLMMRMVKATDAFLSEGQAGFRAGRATRDCILQ